MKKAVKKAGTNFYTVFGGMTKAFASKCLTANPRHIGGAYLNSIVSELNSYDEEKFRDMHRHLCDNNMTRREQIEMIVERWNEYQF